MSRNFDSAWQWSHYGSGHRGFCVALRCGEGLTINPVYEVIYASERSVIDMKRMLEDTKYQREELYLVLLRKSEAWRIEDEVRGLTSPHGTQNVEPDEVVGICLEEAAARIAVLEAHLSRVVGGLGGAKGA
jgi:hypothetical protein